MKIDPSAFVHPSAVVLGNVTLGARASVWPTAVLRGDSDAIVVGDDCNIQDGAVLHADEGLPDDARRARVGRASRDRARGDGGGGLSHRDGRDPA